jgi:hypothetical protein
MFEEGEHETGCAGDAAGDGWQAAFAGLFRCSHLGAERHTGRAVNGDHLGVLLADHFGVDAVASRVRQHLQKSGDATVLAEAAVGIVVGHGSA